MSPKAVQSRKCQSGYGFLLFRTLEDAMTAVDSLKGCQFADINFDCAVSNRSRSKATSQFHSQFPDNSAMETTIQRPIMPFSPPVLSVPNMVGHDISHTLVPTVTVHPRAVYTTYPLTQMVTPPIYGSMQPYSSAQVITCGVPPRFYTNGPAQVMHNIPRPPLYHGGH